MWPTPPPAPWTSFLAAADVGPVDQPFPGRDEDQRKRRRFAHRKIPGLRCEQLGVCQRILGERSLQAANAAGHSINRFARLEYRHAGADLLDNASEVQPKNGGHRMTRVRGLTGANLRIERIDAASFDPDQNLTASRRRPRQVGDPEWRVRAVQNRGLHRNDWRHSRNPRLRFTHKEAVCRPKPDQLTASTDSGREESDHSSSGASGPNLTLRFARGFPAGIQRCHPLLPRPHQRKPKPFVWTKDPNKIIAAVRRGHQVLDSIH